jgi:hypothetical protein
MRGCDNSKIHISSNLLLSVCLLIMLDTLLLVPSLHCNTSLHYTKLHFTTLIYTSLPLIYTSLLSLTLHYSPLHFTTLPYTTLLSLTLHYSPLQFTTLPYTSLLSVTLHYSSCSAQKLNRKPKHTFCVF